MTAKEKAKELVNKFDNLLPSEGTTTGQTPINCALIAVDEIIKALEDYGQNTMELQNMDREFAWWQKVKQEIEKL